MRSSIAELDPLLSFNIFFSYAVGYVLQVFWFIKIVKGALKAIGKTGVSEKSGRKAL